MDKDRVKEYLTEWYNADLPALINRDIVLPSTSKIVTLIGPRRAGKTYILFQHIKNLLNSGIKKTQLIYINCEDPRLSYLEAIELHDMIKLYWELYPSKTKEFFVFIDEPQVIPKWESVVRMFHDSQMSVFMSGSSFKLLSKEIATSLRGRSISFLVLPFSFKEYLKLKNCSYDIERLSPKDKASLMNNLTEYLSLGGYAEIIKEQNKDLKLKIINEYFEIITYKDIIDRYKIKNTRLIKWLLKSSISSVASEISIRKLYLTLNSQSIKASKNTVYDYFSLLEDALFIFPVSRHSFSERKKDFSINKVYINDNCFMNIIDATENIGKKLEQTVFLELARRKRPLANIHYYKNVQGEEVDFVITEGNKVMQLIQVCQKLDNIDTKRREIRSLLKASAELKCKNLIIITEDYQGIEDVEWFGNKGKIEYIPVWRWLLN